MLTLATLRKRADFWIDLALMSLFMQWIALSTAAIICHYRNALARLSTPLATIAALIIAQICTCGCVLAARYMTLHPPALLNTSAISAIITLMALRYFYVQHQWQQQVRAEALARMAALQARIHPHFLFNTLNTIASLIARRPEAAEQAVLDLADLLRATLHQRERITLGEELAVIDCYLAIERHRWGDKLQVVHDIGADVPLDQAIPALLIQPLVENAVQHGLQRLPEGGCLRLQVVREGTQLRIAVHNPRPAGARSTSGHQIAQQNVRQRLALLYDQEVPLTVTETAEDYHVSFTIPLTP